jgi:hypothetical protein
MQFLTKVDQLKAQLEALGVLAEIYKSRHVLHNKLSRFQKFQILV